VYAVMYGIEGLIASIHHNVLDRAKFARKVERRKDMAIMAALLR